MYLIDTNHCSQLLTGDTAVVQGFAALDSHEIATCVIVRGELMFMAERSDRRDTNVRQVEALCSRLIVYEIDAATADWYGHLKAALLNRFGPKDLAQRRKTTLPSIGVSDNDLWIAATAKRYSTIVVSSDADFDRICAVADLTVERWTTSPGQP